MLEILFIYRDKHFSNHNFLKIFENNLCKLDFGFLLLSLKTIANVKLIKLSDFIKLKTLINYDHVIIDSKIHVDYQGIDYIHFLKKFIKSKVSIFLSYDRPFNNEDIHLFEKNLNVNSYLIPNLLKNLDIYKTESDIKNKFYQTHYGLGFSEFPFDFSKRNFVKPKNQYEYKSNIFYSGEKRKGKQIRTKIINDLLNDKSIKNKIINYYDTKNQKKHVFKLDKYLESTLNTRINLVLAGNSNNITYRLYEVLFLNSFFLIDPHFTNFKISESFYPFEDFVFYNSNDLIEKINFYLDNYEKAILIKDRLSQIFEEVYDPYKHGKFLKEIISL